MLALPLCILAVTLLVVHLVRELYYRRFQQHAALPQLKPSLLFGHMKVVREYLSPYPQDAHQDYAFRDIQEALGNPPVTFLDMRPVTYGICVVNSHEAAERISRASKLQPWSTPKSPTLSGLVYLTGAESLLNKEAEEWKALRRRFNPGFAPQHLITLLPCILDKTDLFLRRLDSFAKTGESFRLDELLINLTFDIIGTSSWTTLLF
ncbi:hypothetical protein VTK73DRAFT_4145 [Phialemonium thermophilum]|uniref:Cytochrome P450 n=1 Tax=Phialemonium thermophilum TaxID=223376 RepID=A0ABR3VCB0_9PEZI